MLHWSIEGRTFDLDAIRIGMSLRMTRYCELNLTLYRADDICLILAGKLKINPKPINAPQIKYNCTGKYRQHYSNHIKYRMCEFL